MLYSHLSKHFDSTTNNIVSLTKTKTVRDIRVRHPRETSA